MLKSFFVIIFVLFTITFSLPPYTKAQQQFSVDAKVTYDLQENGKTIVTHDIGLQNLFSTLYATSYTLYLENIDVQNVKAIDDQGKELLTDVQKDGDKTSVKITFASAVVGRGSARHFSVTYENNSFATHAGEVWEVSIPKLADDKSFNNYNVILKVPTQMGSEAYISPTPQSKIRQNLKNVYTFNKTSISQTGITAGFGAFQVFNFTLSYHLENPLPKNSDVEIAIPPDTAFQKVYYQKITPQPNNVRIDADGNWLALYKLSPRQRIDITALGSVQILAGFRQFPAPTQDVLNDNLKATEYWQINDPQIKALASELKTPEAIYKYVSKTLHYDYNRVQPNVQRLGAVGALSSTNSAICMEFTDLFIAIARAAGIPAREINGFAYTENPELQPLSLVADVLHSWPEYFDKTKGVWVPIDPTWASTSGGIDYFNKLDLRHFTFVIHGEDSTKPYAPGSYKLGPNPQKDVYVSFGQLPEKRSSDVIITGNLSTNIPLINSRVSAKIFNPGPVAIYNVYPIISFDGVEVQRDFISVLPPYASSQINLIIPFGILGTKTPDTVKIAVLASQVAIETNKSRIVVESMVFLLFLLLSVLVALLVRLKKINLDPIWSKIRLNAAKLTKFRKNSNQGQGL